MNTLVFDSWQRDPNRKTIGLSGVQKNEQKCGSFIISGYHHVAGGRLQSCKPDAVVAVGNIYPVLDNYASATKC
jgi:hypothetical protein